jgi:hypothetical protein
MKRALILENDRESDLIVTDEGEFIKIQEGDLDDSELWISYEMAEDLVCALVNMIECHNHTCEEHKPKKKRRKK